MNSRSFQRHNIFYLLKSFMSTDFMLVFHEACWVLFCPHQIRNGENTLSVGLSEFMRSFNSIDHSFYSVGKKCQHWHEDIRFTDRHSVNGDFYKLPGSVTVTAGRQVKGYFRKDFSTVVSWFVNHFLIWKVVVEGGAGENWLHSIINRYVFTLTFYFCHF